MPTAVLRGTQRYQSLWAWQQATLANPLAGPRTVTLSALDASGKPVFQYDLEAAYPSSIVLGATSSPGGDVPYETVTFTTAGVTPVVP